MIYIGHPCRANCLVQHPSALCYAFRQRVREGCLNGADASDGRHWGVAFTGYNVHSLAVVVRAWLRQQVAGCRSCPLLFVSLQFLSLYHCLAAAAAAVASRQQLDVMCRRLLCHHS